MIVDDRAVRRSGPRRRRRARSSAPRAPRRRRAPRSRARTARSPSRPSKRCCRWHRRGRTHTRIDADSRRWPPRPGRTVAPAWRRRRATRPELTLRRIVVGAVARCPGTRRRCTPPADRAGQRASDAQGGQKAGRECGHAAIVAVPAEAFADTHATLFGRSAFKAARLTARPPATWQTSCDEQRHATASRCTPPTTTWP